MMRPLESLMCGVPMCFASTAPGAPLCGKHVRYRKIGSFLMSIATALALFIAFATLMIMSGCASPGPSKERLRDLLSQCREANRQRVRIIKEYEAADCRVNPEQDFGTINFGEAGN